MKEKVCVLICVVPLTDFGFHISSSWLLLSRRVWRRVVGMLWDNHKKPLQGTGLQKSRCRTDAPNSCAPGQASPSGTSTLPCAKSKHRADKCSLQLQCRVLLVFYVTIYDCYSIMKESLPWKRQGGILFKIESTLFK